MNAFAPGFIDSPSPVVFAAVTEPLSSAAGAPIAADRSPWGIVHLVGNASEHLCTCAEGRVAVASPLVRPEAECKARCAAGIAIGGANASSQRAITGAPIGVLPPTGADDEWLTNPVGLPDAEWRLLSSDPTFNEHHDPRIGFRCVYPVK
jgi:hypothetical protein